MDEGSIILDYWTPPGTALSDTDEMLRQAEQVIQGLPDVAGYSRRTGTQLGFFVTEPNRGDYVVQLKPRGQRRPVEEVTDALRTGIARVEPAIHTDFGQLLEDNIGDLSGGVPQPIEIKVFGEEQAELQKTARRVAHLISGLPGIEDVFDGITIAGPALDLRTRSVELARHGLTTEDLQGQVEAALVGTVAGDLRVGERVYDVRVFSDHRGPLADLRILGSDGTATRLDDLARVTTGPPEAEIDRQDLATYLGVTARLTGRSLGSAVAEIQRTLGRELHLPAGMSIEYGGLYAQQQQSFKALLGVLLAGLVLVAVILLFEFGDWRAPLLTAVIALGVLPGVFGALLVTGTTLNISSFVGAIMMVGIVGENAVFVIHEGRLELARGLAVREAWATAAKRRLRPVAMTILATASALAPLALALGQGSQLLQPLAIAVIGGFVLSGPLVLWVLPALYARLDPHGRLGRPLDRAEPEG
jgi:Cu/Ag efflux pump CusA